MPMICKLLRLALLAFALSPLSASAEPIKLKLSYHSSDRALAYRSAIKPFVDAVNAEARGLIEIDVFLNGALGKVPAQAQLVRDGIADIAYIIPGYTADQFPDNAVVELPGLFRDRHEATRIFERIVSENTLRGYANFIVIGAFTSEPQSIHTRHPIVSLADLKGRKIRANNPVEAATFEKLGMKTVVLPITQIAEAISSGTIDGAAMPPALLDEYGVAPLVDHHYIIQAHAAPLTLMMNRQKFASLPPHAKTIIRKYSGEWLSSRYNALLDDVTAKTMVQLQSDPRRKVILPSSADLVVIHTTFKQVINEWSAQNPRNRALLDLVEAEIAKVRSGQ